jgi:hypothetical protein
MEWILYPIYAQGAETAHDMQLQPKHKRSADKDLEVSIKKEIKAATKSTNFLTSKPWVKMPETCSAVEGVAMFKGVYCSQCKKSAQGGLGSGTCKCGNPLQLATVQCLAYHWRECQQWFRVSTPPVQYPSGLGPAVSTVGELRGSKIRMLSDFITAAEPPPLNPVLSWLGLDAFCTKAWGHPTFSYIWEGIKQQPQAKVKLECIVFKTAIKDYKELTTAHPTLKQLVFSNRRFVASLHVPDELIVTDLSSLAQQVQPLFTFPLKLQSLSMQNLRLTYSGPQYLLQNLKTHLFTSHRNRRMSFSNLIFTSLHNLGLRNWRKSFAQPSIPSICQQPLLTWPVTLSSHLLLHFKLCKYQARTKHSLKLDPWTRN